MIIMVRTPQMERRIHVQQELVMLLMKVDRKFPLVLQVAIGTGEEMKTGISYLQGK